MIAVSDSQQCAQTEIPLIVCLHFFACFTEKSSYTPSGMKHEKGKFCSFHRPHVSFKTEACFCLRLKKGIVTSSGKSTENICNYCTYTLKDKGASKGSSQ